MAWPEISEEVAKYIERMRSLPVVPYLTLPFEKQSYKITEGWFYSQEEYEIHGLRGHAGIDFELPLGAPVLAAASGFALASYQIRDLGKLKMGLGNFVSIYHPEVKRYTVYGHLDKIEEKIQKVEVNELLDESRFVWVERGEKIGTVGQSGFEPIWDEVHLHFEEIARNTETQDLEKRGTRAAPRDPYDIYWTAEKYDHLGEKQLWILESGKPKFA